MKRPWPAWLIFTAWVLLAALATTRLGTTALALERAEASARRQADLEENVQLALWRMDSALGPLMAEESARPYFTYSALYPAERAFTCMFAEIDRGDVLMPSPLLTFHSRQIRLHFQYGPDGRLSSPQVPVGNMRDLAEARYLAPEHVERASQRLEELGRLVSRPGLAAALESKAPQADDRLELAGGPETRADRANEYVMRARSARLAQNAPPAQALAISPRSTLAQGPLQALWIGPALVLARRVRVEEGTYLQGCWLDWDAIRSDLLNSIADLVPDASLEPVHTPNAPAGAGALASLPVRLVPRMPAVATEQYWSPVRLSLAIAWALLTLAALGCACVLHGTLALSERRGTFVSAVTHELRTPLTTFRLYTEMMDEGMVASAESQRQYVRTLRAEADRLSHLVDNVLAFARLEHGRAARVDETLTPAELLARLVPRLSERAQRAGMELVTSLVPVAAPVRADVSVVEQVLMNLVDNAIKYAGAASDRRIHLDGTAEGRHLVLRVRDHGPGLRRGALRCLFRPFSKSAHDAAQSAPGVGLGLALSRRLARALGGDLRVETNTAEGACFAFTIPFS